MVVVTSDVEEDSTDVPEETGLDVTIPVTMVTSFVVELEEMIVVSEYRSVVAVDNTVVLELFSTVDVVSSKTSVVVTAGEPDSEGEKYDELWTKVDVCGVVSEDC